MKVYSSKNAIQKPIIAFIKRPWLLKVTRQPRQFKPWTSDPTLIEYSPYLGDNHSRVPSLTAFREIANYTYNVCLAVLRTYSIACSIVIAAIFLQLWSYYIVTESPRLHRNAEPLLSPPLSVAPPVRLWFNSVQCVGVKISIMYECSIPRHNSTRHFNLAITYM